MAGDWIKMRSALANDPAVIAMAEALKQDEFFVVGRLHHLWSWADTQSRDGNAVGVTPKWIDVHVRAPGFSQAMMEVGWLKVTKRGVTFPHFDRHNGESAKTRALGTKRAQTFRSRERNADVVTKPLPEKRREEKNKTPSSTSSDDPPGFVAFWTAYPPKHRRVAKTKCLKVWTSAKLEPKAETIIAHVRSMATTKQWQDGYEPAPLTYLNQRRWEDGLPFSNDDSRAVAM